MTIFGFNTNVQRDDVTYHVESQARQGDLVLQTMIFVKGQCAGKHVFSYAAMALAPGFSEEAMHNLLKAQHKNLVDVLQHGAVAGVLVSPSEVQDVGGAGLALKWNSSGETAPADQILVNLHVSDSGSPVSGAAVLLRVYPPGEGAVLGRSQTDSSGATSLTVPVAAADEGVIAQATHAGKSVTRKLRLKK